MERLEKADLSDENKQIINKFVIGLRREELAKSTILGYLNYITRTALQLRSYNIEKPLTDITQDDFDLLMMRLEDEHGMRPGTIRTYKKMIKKFFRVLGDGEQPKWVQKLKLKSIETPVQPHDLLTKEELDKMMDACKHPRDKAMIAVLADSGMRIGALASCRIKHAEFNQYGAILYISQTSKSKKTTAAKGIPLTWSTGFLNQWIAVHPLKNEPDAPLWVTLDNNIQAMSYKGIRVNFKNIAKRASIKKPVNPHSFRHLAVTNWILDGLNEQEIKHRAGWSRGSAQMLRIYANYTDQEINDNIYEKYGLKKDNRRHVTLNNCPRCNNVLRQDDKFCSQCSLVLDHEALEHVQVHEKVTPKLIEALVKSEFGRDLLGQLQ